MTLQPQNRAVLYISVLMTAALVLFAAPTFADDPRGEPTTKVENKDRKDAGAGSEENGDAKKAEEGQEDKDKKPESESVWQLIVKGGWTMAGLGLITVIILAFSLERYFYFRNRKVATKGYYNWFMEQLRNGGVTGLEKEVKTDDRLLSIILRAGLAHKADGPERIEKAIENSASVEVGNLERGLNLLSNLGNLAPLIGFFGTVVGMRDSFLQFVEKAAPTAKDLAIGVETALITTAAGLLIAIPAYLIYNLFIYRIDSFNIELERVATELTDAVGPHGKGAESGNG